MRFKCKRRTLKWDHDNLKNHKLKLYKHRLDVVTSMRITEYILHYLKFKARGINIDKQAEQNLSSELAGIHIVRY